MKALETWTQNGQATAESHICTYYVKSRAFLSVDLNKYINLKINTFQFS